MGIQEKDDSLSSLTEQDNGEAPGFSVILAAAGLLAVTGLLGKSDSEGN